MTLLNSRIFEAFPFVLPFLDFLFPYPVTLAAPNSDLLTPQPKTVAFCLDFICNDRGLTVPGKEKLDKCDGIALQREQKQPSSFTKGTES